MNKLRLGISACLLGQLVRYNGQHKRDAFLTDTLGKFVEYVPVCPEVECGLPVPRESMRLEGNPEAPRLMTHKTRRDLTEQMLAWSRCRIKELEKEDLCGFVFKSKSPSSGMERVKVYNGRGGMSGRASGLFAGAFMQAFPLLPVEDEGRLHDPLLRENFVERIFAMKRYREAVTGSRSKKVLTDFHAAHKYLIMAHSEVKCREMGRMLADRRPAGGNRKLSSDYEAMLLKTLRLLPTVKKHTNVLMHMMGYLKKLIDADEKKELVSVIEDYRRELIPLIVPVTLLNHYVRKYRVDYLLNQVYLHPHPLELKLRTHA